MGYLFVKKGYKKKKTYVEGQRIILQLKNDSIYHGLITRLRNDTIFLNSFPFPRTAVQAVVIDRKPKKAFSISTKDLLLIAGGTALATTGLALSGQASSKEALIAGLTIGYGRLLVLYLGSKISLRRKKYTIGKKLQLQVLDFHVNENRAF